jgi:hypothetical protein
MPNPGQKVGWDTIQDQLRQADCHVLAALEHCKSDDLNYGYVNSQLLAARRRIIGAMAFASNAEIIVKAMLGAKEVRS